MKIVIYGTGYVGLVTGACLSKIGHKVTCLDIDKEKNQSLQEGKIPIYEDDLENIVSQSIKNQLLKFSLNGSLDADADIFVVAVGTPQDNTGAADMRFVNDVVKQIVGGLKDLPSDNSKAYHLLIKSTVPVNTALNIRKYINENRLSDKLHVISNPEFLREGSAVKDFLYPDRIVVGISSKKSEEIIQDLYLPLFESSKEFQEKLLVTSNSTAEMIKYFTNGYLSYKLSFINQILEYCKYVEDIDIGKLFKGVGMDPRIGNNYLTPGPGYGGSCFPKDTNALLHTAASNNFPLTLLQGAVNYNTYRKTDIANRIAYNTKQKILSQQNNLPINILILGLTFKANTDDIRESVSLVIISRLIALYKSKANVYVYDPKGNNSFRNYVKNNKEIIDLMMVSIMENLSTALTVPYALMVIATEWQLFKSNPDIQKYISTQDSIDVWDLHNIISSEQFDGEKRRLFVLGRNNKIANDNKESVNIIITGAAGFLGSNLLKKLLQKYTNANIVCLDNLYTGSTDNLNFAKDDIRVLIEEIDISEKDNISRIENIINIYLSGRVDRIYNFASPASPPKYQKDPVSTIYSNVYGVDNMLFLAHKYGARFLQASTSEIYGDPLQHPQTEQYFGNVNSIGPRACYDEAKRVCETLVTEFNKKYGIDTRISRIFNTYGPNMQAADGRVVSNFITSALAGDCLTVYGDGTQTRSFCYVDDLIEGIIKLMEAPNTDIIHTPFNIGNPEEYTVKDLAQIIIDLFPNNSLEIKYKGLPTDDPKKRRPDITKAKEILDWSPQTGLNDGLLKTVEYFKQNLYENKDGIDWRLAVNKIINEKKDKQLQLFS